MHPVCCVAGVVITNYWFLPVFLCIAPVPLLLPVMLLLLLLLLLLGFSHKCDSVVGGLLVSVLLVRFRT